MAVSDFPPLPRVQGPRWLPVRCPDCDGRAFDGPDEDGEMWPCGECEGTGVVLRPPACCPLDPEDYSLFAEPDDPADRPF